MNKFFKHFGFFFLLTSASARSVGRCSSEPKGEKCTHVVNHSFCEASLPAEDLEGKKTLEEVHSYAELKLDLCSNLTKSFTICSTIKVTDCQS